MTDSFARTFAHGGDLSRWTRNKHLNVAGPGALRIRPQGTATHRMLLSCGIHGDETAPIEMIDRLIEDIASGTLMPTVDLLMIVGNPDAIRAGKRFVTRDMNRLFDGAWQQSGTLPEAPRAKELETLTRNFFEGSSAATCWHLDLHTTIRPSRIERFAIANAAAPEELPADLHDLLHAAGLGALVLNPRSRNTYSSFSSRLPGVMSLTLELGQGKRFGENPPEITAPLERMLRRLMCGESIPSSSTSRLACFEATREIRHTPGHFAFHLPATIENFSRLEPGQRLAETTDGTVLAQSDEHILFPNPNVAPGLRAGLLVRPLRGSHP